MNSLDKSLERLKKLNFNPKNILDLGCQKGDWSLNIKRFFNESSFTLIDGIFYQEAFDFSKNNNFKYIVEVLNDKVDNVEWYELKNSGDSMFKEKTVHFSNVNPVIKKSITLDILFKDETFEFIKIDCQGAEIPILRGGLNLIKNTNVILLEIPFCGQYNDKVPNFYEHIKFMESLGFEVFDITELHYHNNLLIQIDIFFVRKDTEIHGKIQNIIEGILI